MNILITGGCGFIGSHLAQELRKTHNVAVIDNKFRSVTPNVRRLNIDLANLTEDDIDTLSIALSNTDIVYHFASSVGVEYIDNNPKESLQNSMKINMNLFPLFDKYSVKVVYASSSEVYGDNESADETDNLSIGSPDKLRWGYACSKLMSEFLIKSYTFPNVIVRFFNVTGEGHSVESGMVLPKFVESAKNNQTLEIYGDGYQYRTFCDIRDAVEMLKIVGFGKVHNNEIYNIGNTLNCYTINDLAQEVVDVVGSLSEIKHINYLDKFSDEFGEIYKRRPNTTKIQKYYKCEYNLKDIVRSML